MTSRPPTTVITGALGQDGRLLTDLLARRRGERVIGIARSRVGASSLTGKSLTRHGGLVACDITDWDSVEALIRRLRPERVVHLAAVHHSATGDADAIAASRPLMAAVHVDAVRHVARAIRRWHPACHLVVAGSSQLYAPCDPPRRIDEITPFDPWNDYGRTKLLGIEILCEAREHWGLAGSAAILFNHESPYRTASFVSRKISLGAAAIAAGKAKKLRLRSLGDRVDWLDARDVAHALALIAQQPSKPRFVIGSGRLRTVGEFAATALACAGLPPSTPVLAERDTSGKALLADARLIRKSLGWRPRFGFEVMVRAMVAHDLRAAGLPASPVIGPLP